MADFRYMTIGPTANSSKTQWEAFAQDPAGDGSLPPYIVPDPDNPGEFVAAPGVSIYHFVDDNGNYRYDVRLYGSVQAVADDDGIKNHPTRKDSEGRAVRVRGSKIRAKFKANGVSGTKLIERKRPVFDNSDPPVQTGEETWASGTVVSGQWRNILLLGDADDGDLGDSDLIEHTWL